MTETERRIAAAQGYVELGLFAEAREEMQHLAADDLERADVVELSLLCLMGEHRWEEALDLGRRLCQLEPDEPGGFIHAAYCLHEMGRTHEALDMLMKGPPSLHSKAVYFYNLGCYRAKLGEVDTALRMLQKAFEKDASLRRAAKKDPDLDGVRSALEAI